MILALVAATIVLGRRLAHLLSGLNAAGSHRRCLAPVVPLSYCCVRS